MTTMASLHEDMVNSLVKPGEVIARELTARDCHNIHMAAGVSGEAGELLDAIKKAVIYRKDYDINNIIEELGDIEFYLAGLRQSFGITRDQILRQNYDKLSRRYHNMAYSDQSAIERADKQ